jgi:arginyl-tRNA synthetase
MPCRTDGVNLPRRKVTVGYVAANPRLPMDEIGHIRTFDLTFQFE